MIILVEWFIDILKFAAPANEKIRFFKLFIKKVIKKFVFIW